MEQNSEDPAMNLFVRLRAWWNVLALSGGISLHDKRSACVALAGILESRRDLLKDSVYSRDEGALFEIANRFAIRHQNASQQGDYDPLFLDWIFWFYPATIEFTDRIIERQQVGS